MATVDRSETIVVWSINDARSVDAFEPGIFDMLPLQYSSSVY